MAESFVYRCPTKGLGYERARLNCKIQISDLNGIERLVRKNDLWNDWKSGPFKWITDLRHGRQLLSGKLVLSLLSREIIPTVEKPYEMWFEIGGSPARFGMPEYALVTGLKFGDYDRKIHLQDGYPEKGVYDRNFLRPVTRHQLFTRLESGEFESRDDLLKCIYVYTAMTLMGRSITNHYVHDFLWKLIENLEEFLQFPWDSFIMERDIATWRKVVKPFDGKPKSTVEMAGFPWALQWWALEAFNLEDVLGNQEGTGIPRCRRWLCNSKPSDWTAKFDTMVYSVDFVIVCVGRFSDVPNIPEFPPNKGPEAFDGKVIHSMDYSNMDNEEATKFIKGKRVTVVGVQKSALDVANECSLANGIENPCTVLYKRKHWLVPSYKPWGVPFQYLYFTRLAELSIHKPDEGFLLSLLATFLSPLRWAFSMFFETYTLYKLPFVKLGMVPKHRFLQDFSSCTTSTVPDGFFEKVEEGNVVFKQASSFTFCADGVLVDGETTPIVTDLVVLATGFKGEEKLKNIFVSQTFQDDISGSPNESVPLYRECIHPRIPQLAVIGFSESLSNLYTSEIRCRWLAELLDGTFKLPSINEMDENVAKWSEYMKQSSGHHYRRSCIGSIHIWYNDQLCKDMKWNPMRKKGLLGNFFYPYGPMDYASS